jgi:hypothetical protein
MMPTVAELMSDRAEIDVQCDLGTIRLTYRPRIVTPKWQKEVGDREEAGGEVEEILFRPIREAVIEWDLERTKGQPYGLDDESMHEIPRVILNQILWSVIQMTLPNRARPPILSTGTSPARSNLMTTPGNSRKNLPTGSD